MTNIDQPTSGSILKQPLWLQYRVLIISLFILYNTAAIIVWCLPKSAFKSAVVGLFRPYIYAAGLKQSWALFAPTVHTTNVTVVAEIHYLDGSIKEWTLWPAGRIDPVTGWWKWRYRKLQSNIIEKKTKSSWPDLCRYAMRQAGYQRNNPPCMVLLVRHWSEIPPPRLASQVNVAPLQRTVAYTYMVKPEDLL